MHRIFITGGHLTPALAVIDRLNKTDWEIFYIGRKNSLEGEKTLSAEFNLVKNIPEVKFLTITTGRLQRRFGSHTLSSLLKIPVGFAQSLFWLIKFHPEFVLSFGGYVGVPVALSAKLLGIPIIIHEQTLVPSLSSKIIAPLSKKVLVSWPQMLSKYPGKDVVLTGNPIRREVFKINQTKQYQNFLEIKRKNNLPVLYVTGGNQGSHSINEIISDSLPLLLEDNLIIHQCGSSEKYDDYRKLEKKLNSLPTNLQEKYFLQKFIDPDNIGWVLKETDIVIGRSGANTVSELAALGKISILIPLPWSGGAEQQKNAEILQGFGAATIVSQDDLTVASLAGAISEIKKNVATYKSNAQKAKQLEVPNADLNIVSELEKMIR